MSDEVAEIDIGSSAKHVVRCGASSNGKDREGCVVYLGSLAKLRDCKGRPGKPWVPGQKPPT